MLLSDVFCHVVDYGHYNMADDVAIVAGGIATFLMLSLWQMEKPHCEIIDDVVAVADGKATM